MKPSFRLLIAAAAVLLLSGCSHAQNPPESIADTEPTNTAIPTAVPLETDSERPSETNAETKKAPADGQTVEEIMSAYADDPQGFQGNLGGEQNGDTPLPQYFSYRFLSDSVSMRLAGGNYQTITYDFSEMLNHDGRYYCSDYDTDGDFDLFAPVSYNQEEAVTYAVFLWDAQAEKFSTEPVFYNVQTDSAAIEDDIYED